MRWRPRRLLNRLSKKCVKGALHMILGRRLSKRFSQGLLGSSPRESLRGSFTESLGQSLDMNPLGGSSRVSSKVLLENLLGSPQKNPFARFPWRIILRAPQRVLLKNPLASPLRNLLRKIHLESPVERFLGNLLASPPRASARASSRTSTRVSIGASIRALVTSSTQGVL